MSSPKERKAKRPWNGSGEGEGRGRAEMGERDHLKHAESIEWKEPCSIEELRSLRAPVWEYDT
jgi:hypothetical protein